MLRLFGGKKGYCGMFGGVGVSCSGSGSGGAKRSGAGAGGIILARQDQVNVGAEIFL